MPSSLVKLDGSRLVADVVGTGRTGIVILHNENVLKIPVIWRDSEASPEERQLENYLVEDNCAFLENEKTIYRLLGHHSGIVQCIDISEEGIEMAWMRQGSLASYLETQEPPPRLVAQWILELARTVKYIHSKKVIIADIASKNVLLDDGLATKLCDFSDSAAMPLDIDMSQAEDLGLSISTDIFQFGSLAYEISTREKFKYDLLDNEEADRRRESMKEGQE